MPSVTNVKTSLAPWPEAVLATVRRADVVTYVRVKQDNVTVRARPGYFAGF